MANGMNGSWKSFLAMFNQLTGGLFLVFFLFFLKFSFDSNANDAVVNEKLDMIEDQLAGVVIAPVYTAELSVTHSRITQLAEKLDGANARLASIENELRRIANENRD